MQYMSCGKASCVCHRNPQKKQGPYYYLSYKEGGKSQYKYLVAAMCSHIPDRGEQMVRYYGYYSNVSRGKRIETEDDRAPCILVADKSPKEYRKTWARLIQKIGACPRPDRGRSIP